MSEHKVCLGSHKLHICKMQLNLHLLLMQLLDVSLVQLCSQLLCLLQEIHLQIQLKNEMSIYYHVTVNLETWYTNLFGKIKNLTH